MSEEQPPKAPSKRRKKFILLGVAALVLGIIVLLGGGTWMLEQAQAKGIAQGYSEAALKAYQTDRYGRPLPDLMFPVEHFLVETKTQGNPPTMTIWVRHRLLGLTYVQLEKHFEAAGRSEVPPSEQPSPR